MDEGNVYGRILFARMLMEGLGVQRDTARAERLLNEAEQLGSAETAYQKAGLYVLSGDSRRYLEAVQKAAHTGSLPATTRLGRAYLLGLDTEFKPSVGEALLVDAARRGSIRAKHVLAYYRAQHPRGFLDSLRQIGQMIGYGWYCRYLAWKDPTSDRLD
jgi:TPR repeat protein